MITITISKALYLAMALSFAFCATSALFRIVDIIERRHNHG